MNCRTQSIQDTAHTDPWKKGKAAGKNQHQTERRVLAVCLLAAERLETVNGVVPSRRAEHSQVEAELLELGGDERHVHGEEGPKYIIQFLKDVFVDLNAEVFR